MILSNVAVQDALAKGLLVIDPEPSPRTPAPGMDCPYQTSAVDLRLGDEISWIKKGMSIQIDLRSGGLAKLLADNCDRRTLREGEPYVLDPGKFILAQTFEKIALPITEVGPWFAARVEGRSSYARCGLLVHFTAPTIHAGYEGTITLEIMNFGQYAISLYSQTPICQLVVEQVSSRPFRNDSQFQNQNAPDGTKRAPK